MKNLERIKKIKIGNQPLYMGYVKKIVGLTIEADGPLLSIGSWCNIHNDLGKKIPGEIVGFKDDRIYLMPFGDIEGIGSGCIVESRGEQSSINVSDSMLGRVLDGLGKPIDGLGELDQGINSPVNNRPPDPMSRKVISEVISTGVKSIDGLMTLGIGQRTGIFAGSGVGKSVLLGMIARNTNADINVIALIGERGREVREFIERDLGSDGLKRSVVVVATSDQPPLVRRMGAFVATSIAEYFRDQGKRVMFMMDSVTRFAMAQREIGLAVGEPPASKGYTPSVFALLPKLLERAGTSEGSGSITGLYTVLTEGDDMNDPIADSVRSIIDGHIVLSRAIAAKNHFPAVDVLVSASRLMKDIVSNDSFIKSGQIRDLIATYKDAEDLINIGAYVKGSNPRIDESILKIDAINSFLKQNITEKYTYEESVSKIASIVS